MRDAKWWQVTWFLVVKKSRPRYDWNIIENGIKYHNPKPWKYIENHNTKSSELGHKNNQTNSEKYLFPLYTMIIEKKQKNLTNKIKNSKQFKL